MKPEFIVDDKGQKWHLKGKYYFNNRYRSFHTELAMYRMFGGGTEADWKRAMEEADLD